MNDVTTRAPLPSPAEWTPELIETYHKEIARVAARYKLDTYPVQLEIITSEQMMDAYASVGMPNLYHHWSYGKQFLSTERSYKHGQMGLAYEIVINSNPCIAYLMEENTMTMQALVIAHAAYGHNSFFKGNYLFRTWTDAESIIDYLVFARNYITECEEQHGVQKVEECLDSCHALMNYGVDRYKHPRKRSLAQEEVRRQEREAHSQSQVNEIWRTLPRSKKARETLKAIPRIPPEPEENILYFLEKNAPFLEPWQREVIRIVRKIAQYFYPQRQTQVMNEGWATFWHYTILNTMYDEGLLTDAFMMQFLHSHTNVVFQQDATDKHYGGINPYALGFTMMCDIRRICEGGTWEKGIFTPSPADQLEEDRHWFPEIAGSDWLTTLDHAMKNFKDESFILQFLSPKVMRDMHLFTLSDNDQEETYAVTAIHDDAGYQHIRETLAAAHDLSQRDPDIQVYEAHVRGNQGLTLRFTPKHRRQLETESMVETMLHVLSLWQRSVYLETVDPETDKVKRIFERAYEKRKRSP